MVKIKMTVGNEQQITAVMVSVRKVINKEQLSMVDMKNIADVYAILNNIYLAIENKKRGLG